jgi:cullin 3
LKEAIRQIHSHNASSLSFEELYRNAYNLVLHKYGEYLYNGVKQTLEEHFETVAIQVINSLDENLLDVLKAQWDDHKTTMVMIRDILMYMDRNFVNQYKKMQVYDMGLVIYREKVVEHQRVKGRLLALMLEAIAKERAGNQIDRTLLKHTVSMLVELGVQGKNVYQESFETQYLEGTLQYYQQEASDYIAGNTCPDYLKKAEKRIKEELTRVEAYLHGSTYEKVHTLMDQCWIQNHFQTLIHMEGSGCSFMFLQDRNEDLARMYTLLSRVKETLKEIQKVMMDCILAAGRDILEDPEKVKDPVAFVLALLQLKNKYDVFVREAFQESKDFQMAQKQAFEGCVNKDTRTAQYLSLYIDDLFRKGLKGMTEQEVDARLDEVVTIFRFLQDKDVFEAFYKQHLARRLLNGRSLSDEAEKTMISKLKSECGHLYTSKLEGMFQDMKQSEELVKQHKASTTGGGSALDLKVHVLTSGFWPGSGCQPCVFPPEVQDACQKFEMFYLAKHTGRRISWQPSQGTADLKAQMGKSRHELNVSTYQMCILILFNNKQSMSYAEIFQNTQIPHEDLKRHLMSLYVNPKCKILVKESANGDKEKEKKDPVDSDVFQVNPAFECKLFRLKIPLVQLKATSEEAVQRGPEGVPAAVEEDRKHLVEAVIVRIMKSRKTLDHNSLIMEVTRHLASRFNPTPLLIKQRIEKLIEREYLERCQDDRKKYNYLA